MFKNISRKNKNVYKITKPGNYVFYFENKTDSIIFNIQCEKVDVQIYGLYRGKNSDQFTLDIVQNHTVPNSKSSVLIKSILDNKSKLNITSTISIDKNGSNTIANFINQNLLLNNSAHAIISPQLQVVPGDVECTHATTTSPLDALQLQYLTTRGINIDKAKQLLIDGFVQEIQKNKN